MKLKLLASFPALFALSVFASNLQAADTSPQIGLKLIAEGFGAPTALKSVGDGSDRLLVPIMRIHRGAGPHHHFLSRVIRMVPSALSSGHWARTKTANSTC